MTYFPLSRTSYTVKDPTLNFKKHVIVVREEYSERSETLKMLGEQDTVSLSHMLQLCQASQWPLTYQSCFSRFSFSFTGVHNSLKHLDTSYFLGRVCFVVNQASDESIHSTDISNVTKLCDSFDSPMLSGNLQVSELFSEHTFPENLSPPSLSSTDNPQSRDHRSTWDWTEEMLMILARRLSLRVEIALLIVYKPGQCQCAIQ